MEIDKPQRNEAVQQLGKFQWAFNLKGEPCIEEIVYECTGAHVFSTPDRSGYHQVPMEEDSVEKTAFSTHQEHYEWLMMPSYVLEHDSRTME